MAALEFHPAAEIFPIMDSAELDALAADIKAHGQQDPIRTLGGKILDGRNRYRACQQVKVSAVVEPWDPTNGITPVEFVISRNLHRRHLNESQRAMVAAKIANLKHGEKKSDNAIAVSQSDAASLLNVSKDGVARAKKVQDKADPEVAKLVTEGKASVSDAAAVADKPKPAQKRAAEKVKAGKSKTLREAIQEETTDVLKDENGQEVPPGLAPVFNGATEFRGILGQMKEIKARARKLKETAAGSCFRLQQFEIDLDNARRTARFDMPYAVCPTCKGIAKMRRSGCPCQNKGWLNESDYNVLPSELRA